MNKKWSKLAFDGAKKNPRRFPARASLSELE
jgi:hypothetical protein